ncbi:DUF1120 domain-containing protein [Kluyvera sichuanensis]|uniref:DUF1120 domain-containing protein n=1 Tax=Kluyvera sichuanensis TaxID=2725494 RepID=UPI0039F54426
MKKTILAATLMLCASSAFADPTAVLKVDGKLTNAACTPELSNGGVLDYGTISLSTLSATDVNALDEKSIDLTINCTTPTKVSWDGKDNRSDSKPSPSLNVMNSANAAMAQMPDYYLFGMGKTEDGVNIGNYVLLVDAPTVDGETGTLIYRNADWTSTDPWGTTNGQRSDGYSQLSVAASGSKEPIAFTTATFKLKAHVSLQNTTKLAITDDTSIDGQATFTLYYL